MKVYGFLARTFALLRRVFRKNEVYYIGGADTLPRPLTPEEEYEALLHLEDDPHARDLLVEHNLRLVAYIAKRFESTGAGTEELISIGTLGLMKAIGTFRADKGIKLATYASRCIENEILMFLRKASARRGEVSIDEPLHTDGDGGELLLSDVLGSDADIVGRELEEEEERMLVRNTVSMLNAREREIIELRFGLSGGKELTQKEVADRLHISQSYISRLEKRIIAELKEKLKACL